MINILTSPSLSLSYMCVCVRKVDSRADDLDLGAQNESVLALAEERCGPNDTNNSSCNLRTAFLYASSLVDSQVEILVNVGHQELQMEQSAAIQVFGYDKTTAGRQGC